MTAKTTMTITVPDDAATATSSSATSDVSPTTESDFCHSATCDSASRSDSLLSPLTSGFSETDDDSEVFEWDSSSKWSQSFSMCSEPPSPSDMDDPAAESSGAGEEPSKPSSSSGAYELSRALVFAFSRDIEPDGACDPARAETRNALRRWLQYTVSNHDLTNKGSLGSLDRLVESAHELVLPASSLAIGHISAVAAPPSRTDE